MGLLFKDALQDQLGSWPLGYIPYAAGGDFGEVLAVAKAVGDGDDTAFHKAWNDGGDRLIERARTERRTAFERARFVPES